MGKRVGRHKREMARDLKRYDMTSKKAGGKKKKGGKKHMSREEFIERGEDALGDQPL